MTAWQADNIISNFMGVTRGYYEENHYHENYSESLDALVPVWEKLKMKRVTLEYFNQSYRGADVNHCHDHETISDTIQEAAAIATAKVILELKEVK